METIGEQDKFYGYIIGLQIERCPTDHVGKNMVATFEYNDTVTGWFIPDDKLFKILAGHLANMAAWRIQHNDYGYEKLWIKKENGEWKVSLP